MGRKKKEITEDASKAVEVEIDIQPEEGQPIMADPEETLVDLGSWEGKKILSKIPVDSSLHKSLGGYVELILEGGTSTRVPEQFV